MDEHERRVKQRGEILRLAMLGNYEFIREFFTPNISVEELIERYAAGKRDFVDICLPDNTELIEITLTQANLKGAKLIGANLSGANLSGTNLSYAYLDGANLTGANLEGANITSASILGANLTRTNLRGTICSFGLVHGALYHNTIMPDGNIFIGPRTEEA